MPPMRFLHRVRSASISTTDSSPVSPQEVEDSLKILDANRPLFTPLSELGDARLEEQFRLRIALPRLKTRATPVCVLMLISGWGMFALDRVEGNALWQFRTARDLASAVVGLVCLAAIALCERRHGDARAPFALRYAVVDGVVAIGVTIMTAVLALSLAWEPRRDGQPLAPCEAYGWLRFWVLLIEGVVPLRPLTHTCFVASAFASVIVYIVTHPNWAEFEYEGIFLTFFCMLLMLGIAVTLGRSQRANFHHVRVIARSARELIMSEQDEARAELALRTVEAAKDARSRVIRVAMHDLRSPLLAVHNAADTLNELPADTTVASEEVRECARVLTVCSSLMDSITNDMIDFENIESGKLELVPAPFELEKLLDALSLTYSAAAEAKGVRIDVQRVPPELRAVKYIGDARRLQQCLNNGVSNAIKFTGRGGTVTVTVRVHARERSRPSQEHPGHETVLSSDAVESSQGEGSNSSSGRSCSLVSSPAHVSYSLASGTHSNRRENSSRHTRETGSPAACQEHADAGKLDELIVSVVDTGVGLSESELIALNRDELFGEVGNGQLAGLGGSGLGLSITRRLLRMHNQSWLEIESPGHGHGTAFGMHLRLRRAEALAPMAQIDETEDRAWRTPSAWAELQPEPEPTNTRPSPAWHRPLPDGTAAALHSLPGAYEDELGPALGRPRHRTMDSSDFELAATPHTSARARPRSMADSMSAVPWAASIGPDAQHGALKRAGVDEQEQPEPLRQSRRAALPPAATSQLPPLCVTEETTLAAHARVMADTELQLPPGAAVAAEAGTASPPPHTPPTRLPELEWLADAGGGAAADPSAPPAAAPAADAPAAHEPAPPTTTPAADAPSAHEPAVAELRVLHVEDDKLLRRTLELKLFRRLGISFDVAEDGQEAMDLIEARGTEYYQIILMDNQMPRVTGAEATRLLRSFGFRGLMIGLTGDPPGSHARDDFDASGLDLSLDKDRAGMQKVHEVVASHQQRHHNRYDNKRATW